MLRFNKFIVSSAASESINNRSVKCVFATLTMREKKIVAAA